MEHNKSQSISRAEQDSLISEATQLSAELQQASGELQFAFDLSVTPEAETPEPETQEIAEVAIAEVAIEVAIDDAVEASADSLALEGLAPEPFNIEHTSESFTAVSDEDSDWLNAEEKISAIEVEPFEAVEDFSAHIKEAIKPTIIVESIWVSMPNGEQLHMRHFVPTVQSEHGSDTRLEQDAGIELHAEPDELSGDFRLQDKRVFMLHGEVECGRIFYNDSGKGLACYLAEQGYEVFVADLGGRGRSLTMDGGASTLTVHSIVTEAIPRLLRAAGQCRLEQFPEVESRYPQQPSIWVAHGFGGALLAAAWARMNEHERSATQMVFFGSRRKLQSSNKLATLFVKTFCHPLTARLVAWQNAFPATRMRLGSADENAQWFRVYADWMSQEQWIDSVDGFDYRAALQSNPLPPSLYFAATADKVYAQVEDVRSFIAELGCHDARMMVLDKVGRSKKQYDHLSMLLHESAVEDVFGSAAQWLREQTLAERAAAMVAEQIAVFRDDAIRDQDSRADTVHASVGKDYHLCA